MSRWAVISFYIADKEMKDKTLRDRVDMSCNNNMH